MPPWKASWSRWAVFPLLARHPPHPSLPSQHHHPKHAHTITRWSLSAASDWWVGAVLPSQAEPHSGILSPCRPQRMTVRLQALLPMVQPPRHLQSRTRHQAQSKTCSGCKQSWRSVSEHCRLRELTSRRHNGRWGLLKSIPDPRNMKVYSVTWLCASSNFTGRLSQLRWDCDENKAVVSRFSAVMPSQAAKLEELLKSERKAHAGALGDEVSFIPRICVCIHVQRPRRLEYRICKPMHQSGHQLLYQLANACRYAWGHMQAYTLQTVAATEYKQVTQRDQFPPKYLSQIGFSL